MENDGPRLFRILFEVADLDATSTFYATLLDVPARPVRGGRVYFDCGPVILGIVDVSAGGREPRPSSEYVYFAVTDLEAVHGRAVALGCLSKDDVHGASAADIVVRPWGERSFYAADPFGNRLCFVDETTLFTGR